MISTLMQPIINQNDLFVDNNEQPLVQGRLDFLDPVSNNYIDVYSYSEDEYTILTNPIILDVYGRAEQSVFSDRLTYCRLYAFRGYDEHNQPIYEFVRDWYAGHNAQSEISDTVYGIEALRDLDPEFNTNVMVIGYHNEHDCGPRNYYWDENSTLDADNGYVVASNVEASGRWILQFDGPYIPSTYYGVDPQHISNAPALLTYAEQISGKKTAPGIYFVPGHYQNQIWWNTTKKVLLSSNSQFDTGIDCAWVDVIGKPSTWLADIEVSDSSCPVYSSWYKHAREFWNSGSRYKYADGKNWTDNVLTANITNTAVTFYTDGSGALTTDTNGYKLIFDRCDFVGPGAFLYKDSVCRFVNMEFTDKLYLNHSITPENIEFNSLPGQECRMNADNFIDAANLAKVAYKNGITELDFNGHESTTVDCTEYISVSNGIFNTLTFGKNDSGYYSLNNVTVSNSLVFNGKSLDIANSVVRLTSFPNITTFYVRDNATVKNGFTLSQGVVSCSDSTWEMDTAKTVTGNFSQSIITGTVRSNNLELYHSQVTTGKIEIYPLSVANPSSHYEFKFKAENSVFNTDVEFKPDNIWNIYFNVKIFNNTFNGTYGFTCPYWVDVTTSKRTICNKPTGTLGHIIKYEGNTGNCPQDRYYGQVDCTYTQYWYDWDAAWMRGMSNPSVKYKVYTSVANKSNRYFVIENRYGCGQPSLIDNARNFGFGMRMGTNTNLATARLVAMSELVKDSLDSSFNAWAEAHGYTDLNDYFFRIVALPDFEDNSKYDDDYKYYFW